MDKKHPLCCLPWFQTDITYTGDIQPCCIMGPIGNIHEEDIFSIWNGKRYQCLRSKLASGDLKGMRCEFCIHRLHGNWKAYPEFNFTDAERKGNYRDAYGHYVKGDTLLTSKPVSYRMDVTNECNIRCKMCYQNHDPRTYFTRFPRFFIDDFFDKGYYEHAGEIVLVGGEPLFVPESLEIIKRFSKIGPGECQLNLQTNALLFEKYWDEIKTFKNAYFAISMDGCNSATYENIRSGGRWTKLLSILETIQRIIAADKWRRWKTYHAHIVMKSNILELPQMLRFAVDHNADVGFSPMFFTDCKDENIFIYNWLLDDIPEWRAALDQSIEMVGELGLKSFARETLIFVRKLLLIEPWIRRSSGEAILRSEGESGLQKIFDDKVKRSPFFAPKVIYFTPIPSYDVQFSNWISKLASTQNRLYYRDQTPESLNNLADMLDQYKPAKIVELGTSSGLSLRTWLSTATDAEIIAVDLSFNPLQESRQVLPLNLSRVKLLEQDILKTDFSQLWGPEDKVLLYVDAHDQPNIPIMEHILRNALPVLPDASLVIVDDLWYSPITLSNNNALQFFENTVINEIDPLQCFEGHYASYWKGGSFFGFCEVVPLIKWVNKNQIDLFFKPRIKSVAFEWKKKGLPDLPFDAKEFERLCGNIKYSPVEILHNQEEVTTGVEKQAITLCKQGGELYAKGRMYLSMACFQRASDLCPSMTGVYYAQGVILAWTGRFGEAARILEKEIDGSSPHPNAQALLKDIQAWMNKGKSPKTVGHNPKKMEPITRIIKNGGLMEKAPALNEEGEELCRKGDLEGALTIFKKVIEIDPNFAVSHNNLGVLFWQTGETQKALKHFTNALKIDPNDRDTILNCGEVLKSSGKMEDVKRLYSSYLQRNPKDEEILSALETLMAL
ncbi:MAG: tetratricopeptide repeat protein [Deltaproteobacteria bacterium]|nr:MAG: tetratricopeptide repeat protein [Deltaproteobacteria bacterium]